MAKRKKPDKSGETKKLDRIFSKWIRLRDSDDNGYGACCTCGKWAHYTDGMHAGHFNPRGNKLTRFDERNVNLQCCGCNTYRGGKQAEYTLFIEKKYGREVLDELMELRITWKKVRKGGPDIHEIREMQIKYKA